MNLQISNYRPADLPHLYEICLKTGDSGKDASRIFRDPLLIGHLYAAPYAVFHPELTLILTSDDLPIGYIIGTNNSENFYEVTEKHWFKSLREKYPLPNDNDTSADARIIRLLHKGHRPRKELLNYPAHLHIDILPIGQGKGMGKQMVELFIKKLKELNAAGVHLEVGKRNSSAILFYEKIGFKKIIEFEYSIAFGLFL